MKSLKRKSRAKPSSQTSARRAVPAQQRQQSQPEGFDKEFEPAIDLVLRTFVGYLLARGSPRTMVTNQLHAMADLVAAGAVPNVASAPSRYAYMFHAGDVLTTWWTDCQYTDAEGHPMLLARSGEGQTLTRLMRTRFPESKINWAIDWMEDADLIGQAPGGRYFPKHRSAMFYKQDSFTTERSTMLAAKILETGLHNASNINTKSAINFDREVRVIDFPSKYLLPFRRFISEQGQGFLEVIDDWLENHTSALPTEPRTDVSVHLYLHTPIGQTPNKEDK